MKTMLKVAKHVRSASTFSPTAFTVRALLIIFFYAASEMAGLREYTTFLSGTSANPTLAFESASLLGMLHLFLHVAFILLAPASLITAAMLVLLERFLARRRWL